MGFDFMLDDDLKLYLIECNTNPCLETQQSILLQRIIPQVLDQTCKLAVDPFLRASEHQYATATEISLSEFRYEMIYEHKYPSKTFGIQSSGSGVGLSSEATNTGS
jgi:Tubulin-tyrosine ligase family